MCNAGLRQRIVLAMYDDGVLLVEATSEATHCQTSSFALECQGKASRFVKSTSQESVAPWLCLQTAGNP